jgi:hypothetical protein
MKLYVPRQAALAILMLAIVSAIAATGCSSLKSTKTTPRSNGSNVSATAKSKTIYYDFGDVLLPAQLSVDDSGSFVFSTAGLTAGVLSLKGRVTAKSLLSFFSNKMPVDGWQMINKFTGQRNMMLFKKQSRYCTITIEEGQLATIVEIWVAPTMRGNATGSHK